MSTYIDDLAGYMQANGLGTYGIDIFNGGLMPDPLGQYGLVASGGAIPIHELDNVRVVDTPGLQVLCRDAGNSATLARAWQVYYLFDAILEQPIGSATYKLVSPVDAPALLELTRPNGQDAPTYVVNFVVEVER